MRNSLTLRIICPRTRAPGCLFEYRTLVRAFEKEITPHIDQEIARRVLDTNWLQRLESNQFPRNSPARFGELRDFSRFGKFLA